MKRRPAPCWMESLEARAFLDASAIGGVWRIAGTSGNDVIVVQENPADAAQFQAIVNGAVVGTRNAAAVRSIRIVAGNGDDSVSVNIAAGPSGHARPTMIYGGRGNDTLSGGAGSDRIFGGLGNDQLSGNGGDDVLRGEQGDDILSGGGGIDQLFGGAGGDTLSGGENKNLLSPGAGRDWVYGSYKTDRLLLDKSDIVLGDQERSRLDSLDDAELRQLVIDAAIKQWENVLGTTQESWHWGGGPIIFDDLITIAGEVFAFSTTTALVRDHSTTNVQVDGVDEGDIVKTDGQYIYTLADSNLVIVDAADADHLRVVSSTPLGENMYDSSIFLIGDRIAVVSRESFGGPIVFLDGAVTQETTSAASDGWIVPPTNHYAHTKLTVIDVTDRAAPAIEKQESIDGFLTDARQIADQLYLVMQSQLNIPGPAYRILHDDSDEESGEFNAGGESDVPSIFGDADWAIMRSAIWAGSSERRQYETREQYVARLMAMPMSEILPMVETLVTAADGSVVSSQDFLSEPGTIYIPSQSKGLDLMTVARFDLSADAEDVGPAASSSVMGSSNDVYASAESLYVIGSAWDQTPTSGGALGDGKVTHLYKFDLTQDDLPLVATGVVSGWAINQYAVDEHEGFLRIATSSGWGRTSSNNVFVLEQNDSDLLVTGAITGLAVSEQIYAVRFMGDRGFVVTFRQTDPLFALDLSDSSNPRVAGELKIPGFSTYLHPVDENHLVSVGRYADPVTGIASYSQLSLFDVSDMANPRLVATTPLVGEGWWMGRSEAETDPHAFGFYPEQGVVAIPVSSGYWGGFDSTGLAVIKVDAAGFTALGRVAQAGYRHRSLRIGGVLFAVSDSSVIAVDMLDPSHVRSSVTTRIETT